MSKTINISKATTKIVRCVNNHFHLRLASNVDMIGEVILKAFDIELTEAITTSKFQIVKAKFQDGSLDYGIFLNDSYRVDIRSDVYTVTFRVEITTFSERIIWLLDITHPEFDVKKVAASIVDFIKCRNYREDGSENFLGQVLDCESEEQRCKAMEKWNIIIEAAD